ncbi:MAG: hypothetical protein IJJ13_10550 [Lachnospiraceae bacterium]|nr:hypothetical protein [Lachnospiraceae bacterium]
MAEAYETQAFEEIYKHPDWKIEAEEFETEFTKALYDDESVKKEGQAALVHVSNVLIAYNRLDAFKEATETLKDEGINKTKGGLEKLKKLREELEKKEDPTDDEKKQLESVKDEQEKAEKKLHQLENEMRNAALKDDEGQILSSLMLGGTGVAGNGYTITDNSVQDTRKGAKYIREQMTEKGNLMDQMALLDNAMNTGGVNLENGTDLETQKKKKNKKTGEEEEEVEQHHIDFNSGEHLRKKTLNDMFRDKDKDTLSMVSSLTQEEGHQVNLEEIQKFQAMDEEGQNNMIGEEGLGENRRDIMDVANSRQLTEEARTRKGGKKEKGLKGAWNSAKNFFTGGDSKNYVGPLSQEEEAQKEAEKKKEEKKKEGGLKGAWNSVKNFFTGGDKPKPFEIDYEHLSNRHKYMLLMQGLDPATVKDKWRMGMTDAQRAVLARIKYEQRKELQDKEAEKRGLLKASGKVNKNDTSDKIDGLMKDRDKAVARELNDKKFLTTEDAEKVVKDPRAESGRLMNSPKTARNMLGMYKMLTTDEQKLFTFRLALLAYLVPTRRNTIYEVLSQSQEAGVTGKEDIKDPARMYETIHPLTKEDIRNKLAGKKQFPHEKVFMTMVDEYNELRQDARGIKKEERKDLVENQKDMSIAEVARELLNPASGLALFAKLRLLTDASITDDDIKKHIDRLNPNEQKLVNEFMEKLAREQKTPYEDLKKWVEDDEKEQKELSDQLKVKEDEMKKVMKEITAIERDSTRFDRKKSRDLDQKSREIENEIKDLQEKKEKTPKKEREEKTKDFKERVDWKDNREADAITAIGKIRKDLFHLLTATPTAYETGLEATVPALRNRLLVITRLANRFLLDKFDETPDFEDKYKFKEYNPDREEVFQKQLKEEKAGTLGVSEAEKEAKKRAEEERQARIKAEKDMRKGLAERCFNAMSSVKEDERILPLDLEDKNKATAPEVARAINRVINTYLGFDPGLVARVPDATFPDLLPRLLRYNLAATQIQELLSKRADANAAVSEENLAKVRQALKMKSTIEGYAESRYAVFCNSTYGELTGEEYAEKMRLIREKNGEGDFSEEELRMYEVQEAANASGEGLKTASKKKEEETATGLESGKTYLDNLASMWASLFTEQKDDAEGAEFYQHILDHLDNLHTALSGTFNANTDIGSEAAKIAATFGLLEQACDDFTEAVKDPKDERFLLAKSVGNLASGMLTKFGQASYRTVEILTNNNLFQKGDHLWARVMVIGAPLITGSNEFEGKLSGRMTLDNEKAGTKKLSADEIDTEMTALGRDSGDTGAFTSKREEKSLARFRALLGSADPEEMKNTLQTYKRLDAEDAADRKKYEDRLKELEGKGEKPEEKVEEEQKPQAEEEPVQEEKPLEEQEIERLLAEQEAANIEAKEGEENGILRMWQKWRSDLGKYKTGVLGLFADKERNSAVAEVQQTIDELYPLLSGKVLQLQVENDEIKNEAELQIEYQTMMRQICAKADKVRSYAFAYTGSTTAEERQDPFKALCRKIYEWAKLYKRTTDGMKIQSVMNVLQSRKGTDREDNRLDLSSYAMKQVKEGKLRYIFFVLRGSMGLGENPYALPEKWLTRKQLEKEQAEKRKKAKQEQQEKNAQNQVRFSINDAGSEDEDQQEQEEKEQLNPEDVDLDKSYDELPFSEDEDEKVEQELKKLDESLKEGEYEDENGEHEVNEEQQAEAKQEAKRRAMEEAAQIREQRRQERESLQMPKFENVRAKKKRSKDDFALTGGMEEANPEGATEVDIEQKAVANRNFTPKGLSTKEKVAKYAGWALFGGLHYIGKPVKWLGNGIVKGVNFALRWTKKKINGANSMQKTSKIATQEKQDEIAKEIENVRGGASDQEVMSDTSRVPMNWALETAEDPKQAPTVTVGSRAQTNEGQTDFVNANHSWMRLSYTKRDPLSGKMIRHKIDMGYGPRGGFGLDGLKGAALNAADQAASGALMPGALWDERDSRFAAAKTYQATNRQINQMLLEAERYPAGGFNVVSRNCANFVAEVTQNAGINTGDVFQKQPIKLGAKYLAAPLVSLLSPVTKMASGIHGMNKSTEQDLSFERYGEKQITEDEMKLMSKDNGTRTEGYTPFNALQNIQQQGGELNALHGTFNPKTVEGDPDAYIRASANELQKQIQKSVSNGAAREFGKKVRTLRTKYRSHFNGFPAATPDKIADNQKEFSALVKEAQSFFYTQCQGKAELRVLFLEYIGVLNRAKMSYDEAFREARKREKNRQFEESDISEQLKALTSGQKNQYSLNTEKGPEEMTSSPSLMIGYAKRNTSVEQTAETQKKNQGKEKLLNALDRSVDADTSRIWEQESFSDEDVDLAFGTMQNQQESIEHNKMEYQDNYDFTGAEVMQALIFEKIYGGMKGRINAGGWFTKPSEEQGAVDTNTYNTRSKQFIAWLKQDMEISAQSHPDEVAQIEKSIGKRLGLDLTKLDGNGKDQIKKEYQTRVFTNYLVPLLVQTIFKGYGNDQYFSVYALLKAEFAGT